MSQEIKCLKSRRARKVVPAQDVNLNQLMQNYGMEYDSDESADEDFSPTNVESNSSDDSQNDSSSSSSCNDDDVDTTSSKRPVVILSASSKNISVATPQKPQSSQQVEESPQATLQEQSKQKQQQQQLLVQFQQLPAELQQLVVQQLQAQKLPKQQQTVQQQSIQQQLQLQLAKLQLLQQQLQKQQLPKQQLPQQLLPKQPQALKQKSSQQQLPQQHSSSQQQQLPQQQSSSQQQQLPQQQSSSQQQILQQQEQLLQQETKKKQLPQQQKQQLAQKQLSNQPQNAPVQFSQLPSKVQELLIKQVKQSGQGLQHLQQSKFLLLNAQQATSASSSKPQHKGEDKIGPQSKQVSKKVTRITVSEAVPSSSVSKQVTKKVAQSEAKQVPPMAEQLPSQQKKASHKQQPPQSQKVHLKDAANAKGIETNFKQMAKDIEPRPKTKPEQELPKNEWQDTVDEEHVMDEKKESKVATSAIVESPIQEESDSAKTLSRAVQNDVDLMLCFVCLEESKAAGEDMAQCDNCGITVHEGCYGVPEKSDDEAEDDTRSDISSEVTTPWFCDSCRAGVDQPSCELCPSTDGVFKQTIHGSWVHMVCSLYVPGVEYVEPDILSGVSLDQVPANKWGARVCQLCEDERYARTGVCISCDAGLCKSYFHVTCAQRQGLLCEEEENSEDDEEEVEVADPYYAYCKLHCNKDMARTKRRNWLALMSRYKQFSCNHLDNRAKSALLDQRSQYHDLMEKMRKYYKPDEQCIKQERWLHHHPKAFRQLVKKAELLGHASDAMMTTASGRSKVTPSLTCDFVNYYIERNGRIKNLQELNDKLVLTNQLLNEDCNQLQEHASAYELVQQSVQLHSEELQEKLEELYKCIQAGCGKPLPMPSFLSNDTGNVKVDDQKKCSVCSSSSDQHLVITCDTCDKHYHIGCLDPPLTKVPKKSTNYGWQCETCCCDSEDDLKPSIAPDGATSSRSGRVINRPSAYKQSEEPQQKVKKKK